MIYNSLSSIGLWDLHLLRPFNIDHHGVFTQAAGLPHNEIAAQVANIRMFDILLVGFRGFDHGGWIVFK